MLGFWILTIGYGFVLLVGQDPLLSAVIGFGSKILLLDLELGLFVALEQVLHVWGRGRVVVI